MKYPLSDERIREILDAPLGGEPGPNLLDACRQIATEAAKGASLGVTVGAWDELRGLGDIPQASGPRNRRDRSAG